MNNDDITIVIPVYNSEKIISLLYDCLSKALSGFSKYQIIFVNDFSSDDTWLKLENISASDSRVTAICLRKNVGYDNTIMAGLRHVKTSYVVIMDDDLQHSPYDIVTLLEEIKKGHDVVYANFPIKKQSIIKNMGSWLNGKLAEIIIKKPKDLYLSPFKILKGEIVKEIIKYDGPFTYIDGLIFQITSSISQVSISHHKRYLGKGGHGICRSLIIILNFCTSFSIFPLRLSTMLGFLISLICFIISLILVITKLAYSVDVEGWTSIMLAVIMMGGIQLIVIGILGEYVGRSYININKKPQYTIKCIHSNAKK